MTKKRNFKEPLLSRSKRADTNTIQRVFNEEKAIPTKIMGYLNNGDFQRFKLTAKTFYGSVPAVSDTHRRWAACTYNALFFCNMPRDKKARLTEHREITPSNLYEDYAKNLCSTCGELICPCTTLSAVCCTIPHEIVATVGCGFALLFGKAKDALCNDIKPYRGKRIVLAEPDVARKLKEAQGEAPESQVMP